MMIIRRLLLEFFLTSIILLTVPIIFHEFFLNSTDTGKSPTRIRVSWKEHSKTSATSATGPNGVSHIKIVKHQTPSNC